MRIIPYFFFLFLLLFPSCDVATLQKIGGTLLDAPLTQMDISNGLKAALSQGAGVAVANLGKKDGYFKSPFRINLPPEVQQVTSRLKGVPGFQDLENVLLEKINRGAEDAAQRAKPIFVNAIKSMTIQDATNILMGPKDAATTYLNRTTNQQLYKEFNPVIVKSLDKFKARKVWSDAIGFYNKIPLVNKINADLDDYVTSQALNGLFGMVEREEQNIRTNLSARKTDLLKKVFAKQDQG